MPGKATFTYFELELRALEPSFLVLAYISKEAQILLPASSSWGCYTEACNLIIGGRQRRVFCVDLHRLGAMFTVPGLIYF